SVCPTITFPISARRRVYVARNASHLAFTASGVTWGASATGIEKTPLKHGGHGGPRRKARKGLACGLGNDSNGKLFGLGTGIKVTVAATATTVSKSEH